MVGQEIPMVGATFLLRVPLKINNRYIENVKVAIILASARAKISLEAARKVFQVTMFIAFGHQYYLSSKEIEGKDSLELNFLIPSRQILENDRHSLAIQEEINGAKALTSKTKDTTSTLYYDSTQRRNIRGEWTTMSLEVGEKLFRLRPFTLAKENRENVVKLFLCQLDRLGTCCGKSAKEVWECIDALMTDSVSKNLGIESEIALQLNSTHIPSHLLCAAHYVESGDRAIFSILLVIEEKIGLRSQLLNLFPELKSFLKNNKPVTVAAMEALCKLVAQNGKTYNLAEEFSNILGERKCFLKNYKERRFTLTGFQCAAVYYHWDDFCALLENTTGSNQLIDVCKNYITIQFIKSALKSVGHFSQKVLLPFLNFCSKSSQLDCVKMFPSFYKNLEQNNLETFSEYYVPYGFPTPTDFSELEKELMELFSKKCAANFKTQKSREYFDDIDVSKDRATKVYKLDEKTLKQLPATNVLSERELANFDRLMLVSGRTPNRQFTAAGKLIICLCDFLNFRVNFKINTIFNSNLSLFFQPP
jgi:hypothetical protein